MLSTCCVTAALLFRAECAILQLIEKYVHDVDTAVWDLDRMHSRLVESLDSNDKTTVREFLADQHADNNSLLNRVKALLEHGMSLSLSLAVTIIGCCQSYMLDWY